MEYEQTFNISTLPDTVVEENETFILQLSTTDQSVEFSPQTATVVIVDNDGEIFLSVFHTTCSNEY